MTPYFISILGLLGVVLAVTAAMSRVPAFQGWQVERLGRRVGLGVPVELEGALRHRMAFRLLAMNVGGLVGLVVGLAIYVGAGLNDEVVGVYFALALTATGAAVGAIVAALRSEARTDDRPRIARAEAVGIGDYVVVVARILAWLIIVAAVVTLVLSGVAAAGAGASGGGAGASGAAADGSGRRLQVAGAALAGVGVLCLVVFEVAGRYVVRRGRPSASTDELVWNDALTSAALRDILVAPVQSVVLGAWFSVVWSAGDVAWPAIVVALVMMALLVVFAVVYRSTATWYLTQLWPGARRRTSDEERARAAGTAAP